MKRSKKGEGSLFFRSPYWWYKFTHNGHVYTGSTKETKQSAAIRIKRQKMAEVSGSETVLPPSHVLINELLDDYLLFLKSSAKSSTHRQAVWMINAHVRPAFGNLQASQLTTLDIMRYREHRYALDKAAATVNRELGLLRSSYKHGMKLTPRTVNEIPYFPMDREDNIRQGFLDVAGYKKVLQELPESLKALFVCAYHVGCRVSELTSLKWDQVDFKAGFIELRVGTTKNDEGRFLPIYGDMEEWLRRQLALRDSRFPNLEWVFFWTEGAGWGGVRTPPGSKINDFRASWIAAVKRAGYPDLLFHDLRRSAVRNMVQEVGIPEAQAMKISGHKTRSMLERYNIVHRGDVKTAAEKMAHWFGLVAKKPSE